MGTDKPNRLFQFQPNRKPNPINPSPTIPASSTSSVQNTLGYAVTLSSLFWTSEPRSDLSVRASQSQSQSQSQCSAVQASLDPPLQGASRKHPPVSATELHAQARQDVTFPYPFYFDPS